MTLLEADCTATVETALARIGLSAAATEDVKQLLWEQLFVPSARRTTPILANYSGRGRLRGWIGVVAARLAFKQMASTKREVALSADLLDDLFAQANDPELEYLKQHYRAQFRSAFRQAFRGLTVRQRNLLRQHFIDGVSVNKLCTVYRVHRATISRWLSAARTSLGDQTREILMQEVGASPSECESIVRLIESRMDMTLRTIFTED